MDEFSSPTLQRPELPTKPRGSCLVVLATIFGLTAVAAITMLMVGFLWPLIIGFSILGIIGLQYLLWGWWFERIYRSQPPEE
jgi:Zn-dependent protease with chaperone function